MQLVLGLLVSCCLGVVLTEGEVPECPGLTAETLQQLKSLVVTEDVHDKMVGDYSEIWGPKVFIEKDENTCIKYSWSKVDDTHLSMDFQPSGAWFEGAPNMTLTTEKVENGVYILKTADGKPYLKEYQLANKEHVIAMYYCFLDSYPAGSKEANLPHFSVVGVHSHDLKTPMEANIQAEVDEVVKKVQDHKDLLGEIMAYPHPC